MLLHAGLCPRSYLHPERNAAASPMGAMGLMQIMPKTRNDLRRKWDVVTDPHTTLIAGAV
ncbi:transglycosylase SLT domain-containing protein [Acetobacter conturbans]|nr:transglycosylase SLT domain-containing protein [Acetobacter conturbans]